MSARRQSRVRNWGGSSRDGCLSVVVTGEKLGLGVRVKGGDEFQGRCLGHAALWPKIRRWRGHWRTEKLRNGLGDAGERYLNR